MASTFLGIAVALSLCIVTGLLVALGLVVGGMSGNAALPADCAMVFGAAVNGYNQPSPAITRRIRTAARLYKEGSVKRLIVTGGVGKGRGVSVSEGTVMRALAITYGVQLFDIRTEEVSHSTLENLELSKPLVKDCTSIVGISDAYHLTRIRLLASQQGWSQFTVVPADERPPFWSELKSIFREALGVLYYGLHLNRWIPLTPPGY